MLALAAAMVAATWPSPGDAADKEQRYVVGVAGMT